MDNENSSNNTDFTSVIKELQNLNNNTDSNGKKLDQIIDYMLAKEIQEKSDKEQAEKVAADNEVKAQNEQAAQDTQTETYTELLTDIKDQSVMTNYLLSGQVFFMGVLFGVILLNVLWNRFIR